jgi:hypothetical protein
MFRSLHEHALFFFIPSLLYHSGSFVGQLFKIMFQSYDVQIPAVGKVPMCFPVCINVLVQCPGFTVEDLQGPCNEMAVPPMCALATYSRTDSLPPQTTSFDQSNSYPSECPKYNAEIDVSRGGSLSSLLNVN